MMAMLSARPIRFQPILWSQNTAARCSASSTLRSRSCGLGSIDRPVTRCPASPYRRCNVRCPIPALRRPLERAFRADGRKRLANRAQAREGLHRGRLAWPGERTCSTRRPAALAVFDDLIRSGAGHDWPKECRAPQHRCRWGSALAPNSEDAMTESSLPLDHALARRAILKGASLGIGAGLVSAFAAQAQTSSAGTAQASDGPIWSAEYWAKKGDVALNLWRKRVGAPKPGEPPLPV